MKQIILRLSYILAGVLEMTGGALAQGIHFSQYYNAPMLLNPANTALLLDNDYRIGVNYRNQWASIPVPYKTVSAYGDFQLLRNRNTTNWLGLGVGFFNDKAGDGNLSLTRGEGFAAYHVQLNSSNMISLGLSGAYVQRSVDYSKLSFDTQWDGFRFNRSSMNGESGYISKTNYWDVNAGINYAYFPNDNVYIKLGAAVAHVNQPTETFYNQQNKVGFRPMGNIDGLFKVSDNIIVNPSAYYSWQKDTYELLYGTLLFFNIAKNDRNSLVRTNSQVIVGAYHRWNEAIVGAIGFEWGSIRVMSSYDYTISSLSVANKGNGAFELAIIFQDIYGSFSKDRKTYGCPKFGDNGRD